MKYQPSEKFICHISHTFWDMSKEAIRTCLQQFDGEWYEETTKVETIEPTKKNLDIEQLTTTHNDFQILV